MVTPQNSTERLGEVCYLREVQRAIHHVRLLSLRGQIHLALFGPLEKRLSLERSTSRTKEKNLPLSIFFFYQPGFGLRISFNNKLDQKRSLKIWKSLEKI